MATTITISAPRPAPSFTPLFVAAEKFLPEEGLEAKVVYNVREAREQALRGELDYVATAVGRGRTLEPSGLILVGQHASRATGHTLMIRPDVGTPDRISTVVMTGSEGEHSGLDRELTSILAQHGVKLAEADIALRRVEGGHPQQYRALQEGIGDGAPVGAPWWIFLFKQGYVNLGCEADYGPGLGCNGIHATREKIDKDPQQVAAVVRAYLKAVRYCHEDPEGAVEIMLKWSREWGVDGPEIAREVHKALSPYWNPDIDVSVIQRLLNNTAERQGKPVEPIESVLDMRFLEEARQRE